MHEVHRSAPDARRRLTTHVIAAAIAGALLIAIMQAIQPAVVDWVRENPDSSRSRALIVMGALGTLLLAPLVGFAAYVWRLAARTAREGRFPPAGAWTIGDVPVASGDAALARARVLRGIAIAILLLAAGLAALLVGLATLRPAV